MKNLVTSLLAGLLTMLLSLSCMAQTSETQSESSGVKVPASLDQPERVVMPNDGGTGLTVEELRYKDRLGQVTIQHGDDGIRDYYDMTNSDEIYQDGGLVDRGATRYWRLGVGGGK